jgi:AcrR family transcriptional regulator
MRTRVEKKRATKKTAIREPRQRRSQETREKLLRAAEQLFEKRGYEEVTSHDIAAAAGVAIGSFYAYFADKEQLLFVLLEHSFDEEYQAAFESFKAEDLFEPDPRPALRRAIEAHFESRRRHRWSSRVLHLLAHKNPRVAEIDGRLFERSQEHLRSLLTLASKAGLTYHLNIPIVSALVVMTVDHIANVSAEKHTKKQKAVVIDALVDMIYRSLFKVSLPDDMQQLTSRVRDDLNNFSGGFPHDLSR